MARARIFKPEFFGDVTLSEVSRDARFLYMGLWQLMDRRGLMEYHPKLCKRDLFPYDDDATATVIDGWVKDLARIGRLRIVEFGGKRYLHCPHLPKHQHFHINEKPNALIPDEVLSASTVPVPPIQETKTGACTVPAPCKQGVSTPDLNSDPDSDSDPEAETKSEEGEDLRRSVVGPGPGEDQSQPVLVSPQGSPGEVIGVRAEGWDGKLAILSPPIEELQGITGAHELLGEISHEAQRRWVKAYGLGVLQEQIPIANVKWQSLDDYTRSQKALPKWLMNWFQNVVEKKHRGRGSPRGTAPSRTWEEIIDSEKAK